jgi:hypothetical protein
VKESSAPQAGARTRSATRSCRTGLDAGKCRWVGEKIENEQNDIMKTKQKLMLMLLLLGLSLEREAQAFYNPQTGRWLSRDPIGEGGGRNLYGFTRNDGVNGTDILGLAKLQWQHNDCQGCNAFALTLVMNTPNTCKDNPAGEYVGGASGSFNTSCSQNAGQMCDTETHILVRAGRGLFNCCKKWKVTCEFKYDGKAVGEDQAFIHLTGDFLGTPFSYYDGATTHGGQATIAKSFTLTGTVDVDYWGWTHIAKMVPIIRADGTVLHTIDESGSISCSATCAKTK